MLPIKETSQTVKQLRLAATVDILTEHTLYGLPVLCVNLVLPATNPVDLLLYIHNKAGIPIISAQGHIKSDERQIVFRQLIPVGIEAYRHKPMAEQEQVAQRIWSRRAYATIQMNHTP
jgi:hypothetical protein